VSRYLLDSQIVLWLDGNRQRLGEEIFSKLADADQLYYSAASAWEIAIKRASGKLDLRSPFSVIARSLQIEEIAVTAAHGEAAAMLPMYHRDPFDRLFVAQAKMERLTLVSADREIRGYDVDLLLV
jgi:PIN domain nuclease of toxin-antitoxin system